MWRWVWGKTGWRHIEQSKIKHKIIGYSEQRAVHDRQFIGAQRRSQEDFRILGPGTLGIVEVEGVPSCIDVIDCKGPVAYPTPVCFFAVAYLPREIKPVVWPQVGIVPLNENGDIYAFHRKHTVGLRIGTAALGSKVKAPGIVFITFKINGAVNNMRAVKIRRIP